MTALELGEWNGEGRVMELASRLARTRHGFFDLRSNWKPWNDFLDVFQWPHKVGNKSRSLAPHNESRIS
jgi:hypothetical protein